ncbi:hypothetical protein ES703_93657 [subsurface metagenome]
MNTLNGTWEFEPGKVSKMTALKIEIDNCRYKAMIGTGGIGSGQFFLLSGDHTLGREESRSGLHRQDNGLFDPHLIHVRYPSGNLFRRLGIGVGMHVNDGVFGLFDGGDGYLVDGLGAIVFKEQAFGRRLRP